MSSVAQLKNAFSATLDQYRVLRSATQSGKLSARVASGLGKDLKVAAADLKVLAGYMRKAGLEDELAALKDLDLNAMLKAEEPEPAPEPALETPAVASTVDPLFHVPSRSDIFASSQECLHRILDKLAAAQERVEGYERVYGTNERTAAYRKKLASAMRKLADSSEDVDLAEVTAQKELEEVEKEVDGLNEQEQAGGPYEYDSVGQETLES